jgi:hypothetical protein
MALLLTKALEAVEQVALAQGKLTRQLLALAAVQLHLLFLGLL